jgi:hypothetical protein
MAESNGALDRNHLAIGPQLHRVIHILKRGRTGFALRKPHYGVMFAMIERSS